MSELDGNAVGGLLHDVFGTDVTAAETVCGSCGATRLLAELVVYLDGPGTVVRCRSCTGLLIAVVTVRGRSCVDLRGLRAFDPVLDRLRSNATGRREASRGPGKPPRNRLLLPRL